jgi:hypothetical protein
MTVDYWAGRAVPILIAIRDTDDQMIRNGILYFHRRDEDPLGLGLSGVAVHQTLLQLRDARYVDFDVEYVMPDGVAMTHFELTGRGMQVLGEWPRFETVTSPATLGTIIESLAGYADPQEVPQMRKAAKTIRGIGASALRAFVTGAGAAAARHALGLPG